MTTWNEFEQAEPAFAERVRALFDAGRHKTIATLRADGSPRISGIESEFVERQCEPTAVRVMWVKVHDHQDHVRLIPCRLAVADELLVIDIMET